MIGSPIRQTMDQPGVPMKGKDNGFIRRKERIELLVGQPMRMLLDISFWEEPNIMITPLLQPTL